MDKTIKTTGIDGWKIDGSDPLIYELIVPISHHGIIGHRMFFLLFNIFIDSLQFLQLFFYKQ